MKIEKISIDEVKLNDNNPRFIKDYKYKKLLESIVKFPQMMDIRPIVVDEDMKVLGGNMRLKACKEIGLKEISIIKANELTEEQKKEFILKDNQEYGEWNLLTLKEWDKDMLLNSGFEDYQMIDIYGINELTSKYTASIEGSNFNPELINVDEYIKQNIIWFNELMIEFEDDNIKKSIRNIKDKDNFIEELKRIIVKYGKDNV
jgi:hypothetical protein